MVEENTFRADLCHRLHVFPARSPLRDRREDILPLTRYFVQKHAAHGPRHRCDSHLF
jgi:transcriptional regulator with GAF, ATPase, and Fis domain